MQNVLNNQNKLTNKVGLHQFSKNHFARDNQQERLGLKNVPDDEIKDLYIEKHKTMFEIAEMYNVDRTTISNRLKKLGIRIDPSQRKYRILKATPISQIQKEMIIGSTLGDGSIICSGRRVNSYFKIAHCEAQKEYVIWKKKVLANFVNSINRMPDKRGNSVMYGFHTISHQELNPMRELFYENNKKVIKEEIKNYLSPLGLAVWYMDDGSKGKSNCRISTDGFSLEENNKLKDILKTNFNLFCKVCEYQRNNKKYYYLSFNKENSFNLSDIVKPYIVECMSYKLFNRSSTTETPIISKRNNDTV